MNKVTPFLTFLLIFPISLAAALPKGYTAKNSDGLLKLSAPAGWSIKLPFSTDWQFTLDKHGYLEGRSHKTGFSFVVMHGKWTRKDTLQNHLAGYGRMIASKAKVFDAKYTKVAPSGERVMSFFSSLLGGRMIRLNMYTARIAKNKKKVYTVYMYFDNPPRQYVAQLRYKVNDLLANGFKLTK